MRRLFTYLMTHDSGFAPNPFHGTLTLATCKPGIRRTKGRPGNEDWVAGFASQELVDKCNARGVKIKLYALIYLMKVSYALPLEKYFNQPEFQTKKPPQKMDGVCNPEKDCGDNIYYHRDGTDDFDMLKKAHHGSDELITDTGGKNVLVAEVFYYLGRKCLIPIDGWESNLRIPMGRPTCYGYRNDDVALNNILHFLDLKNIKPNIIHGKPCIWGDVDNEHCSGTCAH